MRDQEKVLSRVLLNARPEVEDLIVRLYLHFDTRSVGRLVPWAFKHQTLIEEWLDSGEARMTRCNPDRPFESKARRIRRGFKKWRRKRTRKQP